MRWEASKRLCLKVAKYNDQLVLHALDWNHLLQTRSYLADLSVANIDLLTPQLLAFRMLPHIDNFADSYVHLGDVRDFSRGCLSWLCVRILLLILLLFWFLLFGLNILGFFGFVFIFTFGVWIRLGRFLGLFLLIFLGLFAAFRFFLVFWLAFGSFSLLFVFGVFDGLLFC